MSIDSVSPPNVRKVAGFEIVNDILWSGLQLTCKVRCGNEVKRTSVARKATIKLSRICKDTDVSKKIKLKLIKDVYILNEKISSHMWIIKIYITKSN